MGEAPSITSLAPLSGNPEGGGNVADRSEDFVILKISIQVPTPLEFTSKAKGKSVAPWGEALILNPPTPFPDNFSD